MFAAGQMGGSSRTTSKPRKVGAVGGTVGGARPGSGGASGGMYGGGGGAMPAGGGWNPVPGAPSQLPISSYYQQGQKGLYDDYLSQVGSANARLSQIPYEQNMYLDRFNSDAKRGGTRIDQAAHQQYGRTNEGFSERGIFDSGLRQQQLGRDALYYQNQREDLSTDINRQRQDMGMDYSQQIADLYGKISDAGRGYNSGLYDVLLQSAAQLDSNGNLPYFAKGVY